MAMKKRTALIILVLFPLAGCMQVKALPHMDELLTLKAYSDERDAQSKWVEGQQQIFERLLSAVKNGSIKNFPNRDAVLAEFGRPVLTEKIEQDGQSVSRWLYRNPIQKFAIDRVLLHFSPDGRLIKFEHITSL